MIKFVYFLGINHMLRSIQKITDYLFEEIFTPLLNYICLIMLIVTCTGIICRYVFHIALVFSPELSRYLYIFIIFIGTFLGIKNNTHVGVDVFVNLLPTKMKKIIMILMLVGFVFAQSDFSNTVVKPPVLLKQLSITLINTAELSEDGLTYNQERGISYVIYLYDEDGTMLKPLQGNLLPYLTQAQITGLQAFMDNMVIKANKLIQ